jgi:type IX secretion system PorP/SprF family membrane protein
MVRRVIISLILLLATLGATEDAVAQDPHFSQFYANPIYLNPAFTGTNICPRLIINYRNQWPSIPGAYITYNASYDQYFEKLSGGLGVIALSDVAGEGALTHNSMSFIYAYRLRLEDRNRHFLTFGLQGTYYSKSLDWSKLTFGDQIDARDGFVYATQNIPGNHNVQYLDFSAGMLYYSQRFYLGFAAHHLTEPSNSFYSGDSDSKQFMKYTIQTGLEIPVGGSAKGIYRESYPYLFPSLIFQQQQNFHQLNYGIYYHHTPMVVGIWYRQFISSPESIGQYSDAVVLLAGFEYDKMKIGYSYDITTSALSNVSGGAHEISITLKFNCPVQGIKYRAIKCPAF